MDWEDSSPLPVNTSFAVLEGWSNGTPVSKVSCLNGFSNFNKIGKCHKAKTYLSTDGHLQRIRYSSHNKTNPQYLYNMHLSGTCGSSSCIHQYHLSVWQNENMITARSFGSVKLLFLWKKFANCNNSCSETGRGRAWPSNQFAWAFWVILVFDFNLATRFLFDETRSLK